MAAYRELGHEIAGHGLRWISYQLIDEATERAHLAEAVAILSELTGTAPLGWYTGRDSPNTRRLVVEHGGFLYDSDSYADDLPYWTDGQASPPPPAARATFRTWSFPTRSTATTCASRPRRDSTPAPSSSTICKDSFDTLYREGDPHGLDSPKMLSIGLHARLCGRPGRIAALERFLDYVLEHAGMCGSAGASTSPDTGSPRIPAFAA